MKLMGWRREELQRVLDGLNKSNTPLIAEYKNVPPAVEGLEEIPIFPEDALFRPAGYTDDQGLYYFIPKIAKTFGLGIDGAADLFFYSLLLMTITIAVGCFLMIFKRWYSRLIAVLGQVLLTVLAYKCSDVYLAYYFVPTIIMPLFILWAQKNNSRWFLIAVLIFSGIIIGYSNFIRLHAGTGGLLFLFMGILLNSKLLKLEKTFCLLILFIFSLIPSWHISILEKQRAHFLSKNSPSYHPIEVEHPFWHAIYMGLAYVQKNKYVSEFGNDMIAYKVAKTVDPKVVYCSKEYEQILKKQFFLIIKNDPWFILKTVLKKIGSLVIQIFKFANLGLFFFFYLKFPMRNALPFLIAACFYALPGLLVIPKIDYLLGMISTVTVFSIYIIGLGLEKYCNFKSDYESIP